MAEASLVQSGRLQAQQYLTWLNEATPDIQKLLLASWPIILGGSLAAWFVIKKVKGYFKLKKNNDKIAMKRQKLVLKKRRLQQQLTDNFTHDLMTLERETILAMGIVELRDKLKSGELDPLAVMEAYQARALEATEETNCIVDFLDESRDIARKLRDVPKELRGPLFGIPISVKECFFVKGYDSTAGFARNLNLPAQYDSTFVQRVRELGAIPFCLTNVPQSMKTYACSNPVYGCTTHPMDKTRTPGGSSGGEACLLAQGGSILGIGSDIGGSLRTPSHFCGTSALKPTTGRLPERGRRAGGTGKVIGINSNSGFMSKSVDGVILGMQAMLQDPYRLAEIDYKAIPVPWRENLFNPGRKLKIGWYDDDKYFPATPCCKRAVHEAVDILRKLGHEVVPFYPPNLNEIVDMYFEHMLADNGITSLELWDGEVLDQSVETNKYVYRTPMFVRKWVIKPILRLFSKKLYDVATRGYLQTVDMWKSLMRQDDAIELIVNAWKAENLDIVLAPGFTYPAPPIKNPGRLVQCISYPAVYNILDFPVGTVTISKVNDQDQVNLESYPKDEDFLYNLVYQGTKGAKGLPLSVQVIGRPWNEELILHVMKILEENRTSYP